jgi:signal transduction histidine kinase
MAPPPELVVISDLTSYRGDLGSHPGYRFVELRRVPRGAVSKATSGADGDRLSRVENLESEDSDSVGGTQVSALGADLRNDLNNPLQEIVAMAFVATSSDGLSPVAEEALNAIQRAASNMSSVVNSLEDKIRSVVMGSRVGK